MGERCTEAPPEQLSRSALVVAPHYDDETLGCGGTIARKRAAGAEVAVVFLTDGSASHAGRMPAEALRETRRREALEAASVLGLGEDDRSCAELPDGSLERARTATAEHLRALIEEREPRELYVPHEGDGHADHRAATSAALEALAGWAREVEVYEYPIWHWQQWPWVRLASPLTRGRWRPAEQHGAAWRRSLRGRFGLGFARSLDRRVDVAGVRDRKRAALDCYASQLNHDGGDPDWATLGDVSFGDFLGCFDRGEELFRVRSYRGGRPLES